MELLSKLAEELKLEEGRVRAAVELLDAGNTVPFIARYRKEMTEAMDDVTLRALEERLGYLRRLDERREEIASAIRGQEKMTPEIEHALSRAETLVELEDIYRPFKQKRKTRASVARERGLAPLAEQIAAQASDYQPSLEEAAASYIDEERGVPDAAAALAGACDIIAEDISDTAEYRKMLRDLAFNIGLLCTEQAKEGDSVYKDYYEFSEPVKRLRPHRVLAINRGEKEEYLRVRLTVDREAAIAALCAKVVKNSTSPAMKYLLPAVEDSYDRLIFPSVEREVRADLFDTAAEGALRVFEENLRNLLMGAPLPGKTVMGYDPGFRTGCKLAVVDPTGRVLDTAVIYPTEPWKKIEESRRRVLALIEKYKVDVIAIGNGTASRESEQFIAETIRASGVRVSYTIVSESGASVYSASKLGAEEFPDFDVTERSAVSIARRLQDPLAELVKIDPKAIGVGQYQHDMKQARLTEALDGVVEDCVNRVGVDINTASYSLLSHISGINAAVARNIVAYREANGAFRSRAQILRVPKIGAKAFEQCAGFLRVSGGNEILDNTGVHPESYPVARALLDAFGFGEEDVRAGKMTTLRMLVNRRGTAKLAAELGCGEPTLIDIVAELEKPGRDVRESAPAPVLRTDVLDIKDLKPDMLLRGTVRNVVDFGAFVDIGVHQDGLLHISEMSDRFISHPRELLSVGDVIEVRIKSVDVERKRIALSRKNMPKEG